MSAMVGDRGVAPALLGAPPLSLGAAIGDVCASSACALHLDVLDGVYAGDISFGTGLVRAAAAASSLPVQIHLQVAQVERVVARYAELGDLVVVHHEIDGDPARLVATIRDTGTAAGIALAPSTPVSVLDPVLTELAAVIVMTSAPGTSDYEEQALSKLTELAATRRRSGLDYLLIADGGITRHNAPDIWAAGADQLAAASAVFHHPDGVRAGVRALEGESR